MPTTLPTPGISPSEFVDADTIPGIGNLLEYKIDRLRFLRRIRDDYGDYVRFRMMKTPVYLIAHPDAIQWIMVKNFQNYTKGGNLSELLGNGLFTAEGKLWATQRRLLQPIFHVDNLAKFEIAMVETTERWLNRLRLPTASTLDMSSAFLEIAFENAVSALFGTSVPKHFEGLNEAVNFLTAFLTKRRFSLVTLPMEWRLPSHQKFRELLAYLYRVVDEMIVTKRAELANAPLATAAPKDILTQLLLVKDDETGAGMSDHQLRDEAVTFLLAGYETTGLTMSWVLYNLSLRPALIENVVAEIDRVPTATLSFNDLTQLPQLEKVIWETLRLFPTAWAWTRTATESDTIQHRVLPKGATAFISTYLTHRHPDFWPDPDTFDPERFAPAEIEKRHRFCFFPFGMGPRGCIGRNFAMQEMKFVLANFLKHFTIKPTPETARVKPDPQVTLGLRSGLKLRLRERAPA